MSPPSPRDQGRPELPGTAGIELLRDIEAAIERPVLRDGRLQLARWRMSGRQRLWAHYAGNAESSTLRKTLGCLLADELGIQLRRVGSARHRTFADGEQLLLGTDGGEWVRELGLPRTPVGLEQDLITSLDLSLDTHSTRH